MAPSLPCFRVARAAAALALLFGTISARAQGNAFDLTGPALQVSVTHRSDAGERTLPLSQVPNLSAGDRLRIAAVLPSDQGAHYRMVLAFLRGATNPPPEEWLSEARTWKPKDAVIDVGVPAGAQQALVFLVPDTGGAFAAVRSAVRQRPGAFVRASQDLNQAMLDRTRLESFVAHLRGKSADEVAGLSPVLAKSLAVKLDPACLQPGEDPRAACLTPGQSAAVLADGQTSSIAQTLAGAPANIALQLAATPQAGYGYYSAYIGVFRDLARMLGAFQSAQLQFIPALNVQQGARTNLLLNTVPSFRKPQSVLVAALPTVAPPARPPLEAGASDALCLARPDLVLPVSGAPLVFSTDYAHDMRMRVATRAGSVDVPVTANAARGGFVVGNRSALVPDAAMTAQLHGAWGFAPFEGPTFKLVSPTAAAWSAGDATLVVGRDAPLTLTGGAAACVSAIRVTREGLDRSVPFEVAGDALRLKVPLGDVKPGMLTLEIERYGSTEPQRLRLRGYAEASRIDGFTLHAGDAAGVMTGARLDQIASLAVGNAVFLPGALTRSGTSDRLELAAPAAAFTAGQTPSARATLSDGRSVVVAVKVLPPRPDATLLSRSSTPLRPRTVPIRLFDDAVIASDSRLTFSLRADAGTSFRSGDAIEVAADGGTTRLPAQLQDNHVAVASLDPAALGLGAHGPLRYRIVQGEVAGDWRSLGTLVRLPTLAGVSCAGSGAGATCTIAGNELFLLQSVGGTNVPDGFTGASITVPRAPSATLVLRDAPDANAVIDLADAR
ncbi:hypothetical protein [uncultured Sphingomonas sp.]|uniref:hypothetical protein n=1 Tax=uncultured Sphingomonas sp. TaxID=158754 RepID=UPI0025D63E27|nr:hypothetical protein [uncultured Sphingomonas sp.]